MNLVQIRTQAFTDAGARLAAQPGRVPLVDRHARAIRYLRVSLTDRCNYRCTYCMPDRPLAYAAPGDTPSLDELVVLCRAFARWGIERVRLTGGEPTLRDGLPELVASLRTIPTARGSLDVTLTTNGHRLAALARPLAEAGLHGVTVSLDSLDPERFRRVTRRGELAAVLAGIEAARAAGLHPIKLNIVAVRGFNDDELSVLARFAWERGAVPRFIELMPMAGGELHVPGQLMAAHEVRSAIEQTLATRLLPDDGGNVRGLGPARYFCVADGHYRGQRLGTIAPMTENFCHDCNRLRLSATGRLHGCLARDDTGDLRAALRSANPLRLEAAVRHVLGTKGEGHGFGQDGTGGPAKAMISIGG